MLTQWHSSRFDIHVICISSVKVMTHNWQLYFIFVHSSMFGFFSSFFYYTFVPVTHITRKQYIVIKFMSTTTKLETIHFNQTEWKKCCTTCYYQYIYIYIFFFFWKFWSVRFRICKNLYFLVNDQWTNKR